jgi:hypothetical protein
LGNRQAVTAVATVADYACRVFFAGTFAIARSAIAVIVSDGLTPGLAGTAEPSQIIMFVYPNTR